MSSIYERDYASVPLVREEARQFESQAELMSHLTDLEKAMREAAENLEFERAAQMRDEAERIRKMGLGMVDNASPVRE